MRFDFAADPWGMTMLAAAALWLLSFLVMAAALLARTSRRASGRIMLVALLAFFGAAGGGTWERIQHAEAIAAQPPPPEAKTIIAKVPPPDPDLTGEPAAGATAGGLGEGSDPPGSDGGTGGGDDGEPASASSDPAAVKVPERVAVPQAPPLPTEPDARAAAIREILQEARKAAGGGRRCGTLQRVAEAWARLRTVPVDRRVEAATADLETCRRKLLYSLGRRHRAQRVEARDAFYDALPERMRTEHGLRVHAAISGLSHERLRIGGAELDATRADALMDGGLRAELMELEFAHVVLSDGNEARTYEFEVPPDHELGLPDLRAVGLGEPLELPGS